VTTPPEEISDQEIERLITALTQKSKDTIDLAPEFQQYFEEQQKKVAGVSAADYIGQLYLWMFFWPWSMSIRIIRKVVTLRFLRDAFIAFFNLFRPLFDRIADRHKAEIVILSNNGPTAPPPSGGEQNEPVTHAKEAKKARHIGGTSA
jgi:hypothetical protein